jgi:hypothetical protein
MELDFKLTTEETGVLSSGFVKSSGLHFSVALILKTMC